MKPLARFSMLTPARAVVLLAGIGLLAAWITLAARARAEQTVTVARPPSVSLATDPLVLEIREQAARLKEHLGSGSGLRTPSRNPFRFVEPASPRLNAVPGPAAEEPAPVLDLQGFAPRPALTLSGIAEDVTPQGLVRTAVISGTRQLWLAREGDRLGDRFEVGRIGAEVVEIRDLQTGSSFSLALK